LNRDGTFHEGALVGDRYLIESLIGEGAFARTYRARDTRLERVVAIKILRPHMAADPAFLNRFQQEARASARIDHPNVVHVYDSGEDAGTAYLVMQYVPGRDLKQHIIEQAPLPVADAIQITREILNGLAAVHRAGIIHRDIKPQNVLLGWDGIARVTDFGIAYEGSQNRQTFATEQGTTLGTPAYMAPEQARGEAVIAATDIYAVGIVLFELLTGNLPFTAENQLAMMVAHVEQAPPAPGSFRHGIPADLDVITLRAMAKDPGQRFASAADMERLLAFAERKASSNTVAHPLSASLTGRGKSRTEAIAFPDRGLFPPPTIPSVPAVEYRPARRGGPARWIVPLLVAATAIVILVAAVNGAFDRFGGDNEESPTRTPQGNTRAIASVTRTAAATSTLTPQNIILRPTRTPVFEPEREPTETEEPPATKTPELEPTETTAPDPTEPPEPTRTVKPTETAVPVIEDTDEEMPTIAPVAESQTEDSSANAAGLQNTGVAPILTFNATDWQGGVTRSDSGFLGRPWTAIYGAASGAATARLLFTLEATPTTETKVVISGVDDESGGDSPIVITINGVQVYADSSPFGNWDGVSANAPWTDVALTVPPGLLTAGSNEIVISNVNPVGERGLPPYVLLSTVTIDPD